MNLFNRNLRINLIGTFVVSCFLVICLSCSRNDLPGKSENKSVNPSHPKILKCLLTWEGNVDGSDIIKFRKNECFVEHEKKQPVNNISVSFDYVLSKDKFPVILEKIRGRGTVDIVSQGNIYNGYTLSVRVDDSPFKGSSKYSFSVYSFKKKFTSKAIFYCYANVDEDEILTLEGNSLKVNHVSGRQIHNLKYCFIEPNGIVNAKKCIIRKLRGRGTISVFPIGGASNVLKVRITDDYGGSDIYEFIVLKKLSTS